MCSITVCFSFKIMFNFLSFIKIQFAYHKFHSFKVYNLMCLAYLELVKHHYDLILDHAIMPPKHMPTPVLIYYCFLLHGLVIFYLYRFAHLI